VDCIFDGLDESTEPKELIENLQEVISTDSNCRMRFIVLSREPKGILRAIHSIRKALQPIMRAFSQNPTVPIGSDGSGQYHEIIVQQHNEVDIKKVITRGLEKIQKTLNSSDESTIPNYTTERNQKRDRNVMRKIKKTLLKKANGVILWAILTLGSLNTHCKRDGVSRKDLLRILENLPSNLPDLYQTIIRELRIKDEKQWKRSRSILMWVSATSSVRPLTTEELFDALDIPEQDNTNQSIRGSDKYWANSKALSHNSRVDYQGALSDWCGPFIEVVTPSNGAGQEETRRYSTVQLLHETVTEFFTNPHASGPLHFNEEAALEHVRSNRRRYIRLQLEDWRNHHQLDRGISRDDACLTVEYLRDKFILLYFAEVGSEQEIYELHELANHLLRRTRNTGLYIQTIFDEAYESGTSLAVRLLLRLSKIGKMHDVEEDIWEATLNVAVKARSIEQVRLLGLLCLPFYRIKRRDCYYLRQKIDSDRVLSEVFHYPESEDAINLGSSNLTAVDENGIKSRVQVYLDQMDLPSGSITLPQEPVSID
jgi:hypothetical protein